MTNRRSALLAVGLAVYLIPLASGTPASAGDLRFSVEALPTDESPDSTWRDIDDGVQALYFHRTLRCFGCLEMERSILAALQEAFPEELGSGWLQWGSIDYEAPEDGKRWREAYKLDAIALILVVRHAGETVSSTRMDRIWEFEGDPAGMKHYLEDGILACYKELAQASPVHEAQAAPSPAEAAIGDHHD